MPDTLPQQQVPPIQVLGRLWHHLPARRKHQFIALGLLMALSALAEAISLGAIIPFLAALADPARVLQHPWGMHLAGWLGITEAHQLPLPMATIFAGAAIFSAMTRVLQLWANTRLAYAIGGDFSVDCYHKTLHQPYEVHLSRNSSLVLSTIAKKVGIAIAVLYQLTTLLSSLVILLAVVLALLAIDWKIALLAGSSFTLLYLVIVRITKRTLFENSLWSAKQEDRSIQVLQEGLGGVRDILLDGNQSTYSQKYADIIHTLRKTQATNVTLAGAPRFLMEGLGISIIAAAACYLTLGGSQAAFANALPALGAFALGAQRLLPTLQQIYAAWAGVVGNHGAVADVLEMLDQPLPQTSTSATKHADQPLTLERTITLQNISFRYTPQSPWVLKQLTLTISKGARVGIIGSTGSGKSTVLDILMALLKPTNGSLVIDQTTVDEHNARAWQRSIAHVPQHVFLTDASIAENISFGVPRKAIDMDRVREAARKAQLADFIESRPEGYQVMVGERGIRLSGGQMQRIGIARALYKHAPVLILDEATSALDTETESMVMETIDQLDRNLTLIIVAHRLSTLKSCDYIFELEHGQARRYASFKELEHAQSTPAKSA